MWKGKKKQKKYFYLKKRRRDYWSHSFSNPFYIKKRRRLFVWLFNTVLGGIIVGFIIYFFFFSNFFLISEIEVSGGKEITNNIVKEIVSTELGKRSFLIIPQDNILFLSKNRLDQKIKEQLVLDKLEIKKKGRHKLSIIIAEKPVVAYLFNQGRIFTLDHDGYLVGVVDSLPSADNNLIIHYNERNLDIGEQIGDGQFLQELNNLYKKWNNLNLPAWQYVILNDVMDRYLQLQTQNGFKVYLSRQYSIDKQLANLKKLLREQLKKDEQDKLEYIDLRVEGWIYYK